MNSPLGSMRRLLDKAYKFQEGAIRVGLNESKEHVHAKVDVCLELIKVGTLFTPKQGF